MSRWYDDAPEDEWIAPAIRPAGWSSVSSPDSDVVGLVRNLDGLKVLMTVRRERDGRRWFHVSCSKPKRYPDWEELKTVKELFVGENVTALQVLPPASSYVNYDPRVLHLWVCLDGEAVPDFAGDRGGMI